MEQLRKVLFWSAGQPGGAVAEPMWWVGEMESKAISASTLKLKLKLTEAELGNLSVNQLNLWLFIKMKTGNNEILCKTRLQFLAREGAQKGFLEESKIFGWGRIEI